MLLKIAALFTIPLLLAAADSRKLRVLVLCTGNSARSQMAEGFLKSLDPRLEVYSAGTKPAQQVNPLAVAAMKEVGIDITGEHPKSVNEFLNQSFDFVITVCDDADKNCPLFRGKVKRRVHMGFEDPARSNDPVVFRKVRDEIREKFAIFFEKDVKRYL